MPFVRRPDTPTSASDEPRIGRRARPCVCAVRVDVVSALRVCKRSVIALLLQTTVGEFCALCHVLSVHMSLFIYVLVANHG